MCTDITEFVGTLNDKGLSESWDDYLNTDAGSVVETKAMSAFMVYIGHQVLGILGEDLPPIPPSLASEILQGGPARELPLNLGDRAKEAQDTEYQNITTAVWAMMVDNGIASIPNLDNSAAGSCTTGTNRMSTWPDISSDWTGGVNGDKTTDPNDNSYAAGDKPGFLLYTHDITGDGYATSTVNYMTVGASAFCYTSTADGTITQYKKDGTQTNP